jgi:hypothetical protein
VFSLEKDILKLLLPVITGRKIKSRSLFMGMFMGIGRKRIALNRLYSIGYVSI